MTVDLSAFDALITVWRSEVDEAIEDNDEVRSYIRELEDRIDNEPWSAADDDDVPSGDELVEELEQYLRDQDDDEE